ncbi:MAG: pyridoxal phosphate-dependent aminotransferase [bacterium]|nr:pyridoxal phosphate-dependent aminotransferase [bacterium]
MIDLNYGENYKEEIDLKHEIEEKIAQNLGVPENHVLLNYGSNSNLILIFSAFSLKSFAERGRKLKLLLDLPNYFFSTKQLSEWFIETVKVERELNFELSIDKFVLEIKNTLPDIVLITTPNNPTGKTFSDNDLQLIIESLPNDAIVLIDRSCINVLPEINTKSILEKYKDKKIIVLHSFSKSHSLSDERLGYLVTNNSDIADFLYNKRDLNHNINAVKKCLKIFADDKIIEAKKKILMSCHNLLKAYFDDEKKGKYFESFSNFALIELPQNLTSELLEEKMIEKNILIMGGHKIEIGNRFVRLHMSGTKEIEKFLVEYDKIRNL